MSFSKAGGEDQYPFFHNSLGKSRRNHSGRKFTREGVLSLMDIYVGQSKLWQR